MFDHQRFLTATAITAPESCISHRWTIDPVRRCWHCAHCGTVPDVSLY